MEGEGLDFEESPAPAVEGEQPLFQQDEIISGQDAGTVAVVLAAPEN